MLPLYLVTSVFNYCRIYNDKNMYELIDMHNMYDYYYYDYDFETLLNSMLVCRDYCLLILRNELLNILYKIQDYGWCDRDNYLYLIDYVCSKGYVNILNLWYNTHLHDELNIMYSYSAVDNASQYNHIQILQWWEYVCFDSNQNEKFSHKRPFKLEFKHASLLYTCVNGNMDCLLWWEHMHKTYDTYITPENCDVFFIHHEHVKFSDNYMEILKWWEHMHKTYNIKIFCDDAIDRLSKRGKLDILDWWVHMHTTYGLKLVYSKRAFKNINTETELWWNNACRIHNLRLKYDNKNYTFDYELNTLFTNDIDIKG